MNRIELLTVEDCFQISSRGVVILPNFSVPNERWKERVETVVVVKPDGHDFEATARFNLEHFKIPDPKASIDKRCRIVVSLPGRKKDEVPVGSKILVSQEVRDALFPASAA